MRINNVPETRTRHVCAAGAVGGPSGRVALHLELDDGNAVAFELPEHLARELAVELRRALIWLVPEARL